MPAPFRQLLPKTDGEATVPDGPEPNRKRKAVSLACQRCRSRKVKCDAERPTCSGCHSKGLECQYDDDPETTPHANLKREYRRMEQQQQDLLELFKMLKDRPESDANVILERLRSGTEIHSLISFIKEGDLVGELQKSSVASVLPQEHHSTEVMLNINHPQAYPPLPPLNKSSAQLGLKEKNILNLDPEEEDSVAAEEVLNAKSLERPHRYYDDRLREVDASRWTKVTNQNVVVANLLSLYLSWDHATLRTLDEDYFLDQISTGGTDYCSPLLVNAMLAAASLNYAAIDPQLSGELGPAFYDEAKRLWHAEEGQGHDLLRVPASIFLSMWCRSNSMNDLSSEYLKQGVRVALGLGLFDIETQNARILNASDQQQWRGRAVVAWGLFNWQTIQGFFLDIDTHLSRHPPFALPESFLRRGRAEESWNPFPLIRPTQKLNRDLGFRSYSELFVILHRYLLTRDPTMETVDKGISFQKAVSLHTELLVWADNLPAELVRGPDSLPMVVDMHMFYHGVVIQVFREFTGVRSSFQNRARELMQASLSQLRRLLVIQRYRYDGPPYSCTTIGSVHVLTFALVEDLAKSESVNPEASFYLILCAEAMKKYGDSFPAVRNLLRRLLSNAEKRYTNMPEEVHSIFQELDARLFGGKHDDYVPLSYPLDIQIGLTDRTGVEIEEAVKATFTIDLGRNSGHEDGQMVDGVVDSEVNWEANGAKMDL
ncbi:hypothetical protein BJ170DRAFT_694222 [Xylariales sp. AK1849]|nr:hypothetical protein BJ170DRAFT_694222 [Xylariales sp. AK1849]